MRKYTNNETKKLETIICNQCGRALQVENGILQEGVCHVVNSWGYFSGKDTEIHSLDLCEECYDRWIAGFAVPVAVEEDKELL